MDLMRKTKQQKKNVFLIALGDAVRERRIDLLLTQEGLGVAAGLHRTYVTDIESGKRNVATLTLLRIAEALKLPLSDLILAAEAMRT
jgi:transcriptional regulator with XRE-family HTH domain